MAMEIFHFQAINCAVYKEYLNHIGCDPQAVADVNEIPPLPIGLFKTHEVYAGPGPAAIAFTSSGTTGMVNSKHLVYDLKLYEASFNHCLDLFYGSPENYCILSLLPSYLERKGSSLVYMADHLVNQSGHPDSGFYLHNYEQLADTLQRLEEASQPTLLLGVTYALLNLIETCTFQLEYTTVMETGGMKGQRKEMIREELHETLCKGFGVEKIHSEYGMTELLSQAYSKGDGLFRCPPWMRVSTRQVNDPFAAQLPGKTGGINIIDLANVYSCSFIATQDLGRIHPDGTFEVLGRFDHSDIRGCNLLV